MNLTITSIKRPAGTIILMVAVILVGILSYLRLPTNMLPDITYPLIKVYIYWEGATPEQVENEIAMVVERKISTVDNLDYIESNCEEGVYTLLVNFDYNVDRDVAYQDVIAKMGLVRKELPKDASEPVMFKADPSQLPVVEILVSDENKDLTQLRTWIDNEFQEQFSSIKGSAGTALSGGMIREIRVHLDQTKMQAFNITTDQIAQRLRDENIDLVGGRVLTSTRDYVIRTYTEFQSLDEIKKLPVKKGDNGTTILLEDVAEIKDYHAIQRIRTKYNGLEGVRMSIFKQAEANSVEVSDRIRQRLNALKAELSESLHLDIIYDEAEYIRSATAGVRDAVLIAALLVVLVTSFFLSGWKRVLVLIISMPVTVLASFFVMQLAGFSINIFTLGGLVVSMTVILDNSVVMLENITRLQEHEPKTPNLVQKAALQVSGAIITATVTFLSLFIPFLLVSGLASLLFRELILTIAIVILFSMIVSLTVTPSLTALFFPEGRTIKFRKGFMNRAADLVIKGILWFYMPLLRWCLKLRWLVLLIFFLLLIPGYLFLKKTGSEFLPRANDGLITVKVIMPTGTSMEETDRVLAIIEDVVRKQEYIHGFATLAGGRVWGLVTTENGVEGEVNIQLVPAADRPMNTDEYVERLRPVIMNNVKVPAAVIKVLHTKMKGIKRTGEFDIEIEILAPRSESMAGIYNLASQYRSVMAQKDYLTGVDISLQLNKPEYNVSIDRHKAYDLGIDASDIGQTIKTMVAGNVPTRYKEGPYYYPLRLVTDEKEIKTRQDLENIFIFSPIGAKIPLSTIASVNKSSGPLRIDRKNQDRMIKVTANVTGISVGEATALLQKEFANINLPVGYKINYGGQSQMLSENMQQIQFILLLALFFAYVVMVLYFESFTKPFLIIIRIPLSLAGISYALYVTGTPLSVTALIGVIMLTGIEVNNGVLLLTFIDQLRAEGRNIRDAIMEAANIRLRPILITDIVGFLGLLPLALTWGEGTEMLKPMAVVVIGGLIMGVLLVFIFVPVAYLAFYGKSDIKKQEILKSM